MPAKPPDCTRHGEKAIVIVDDHPLVRRGLTALINNEPTSPSAGKLPPAGPRSRPSGRANPTW